MQLAFFLLESQESIEICTELALGGDLLLEVGDPGLQLTDRKISNILFFQKTNPVTNLNSSMSSDQN